MLGGYRRPGGFTTWEWAGWGWSCTPSTNLPWVRWHWHLPESIGKALRNRQP